MRITVAEIAWQDEFRLLRKKHKRELNTEIVGYKLERKKLRKLLSCGLNKTGKGRVT